MSLVARNPIFLGIIGGTGSKRAGGEFGRIPDIFDRFDAHPRPICLELLCERKSTPRSLFLRAVLLRLVALSKVCGLKETGHKGSSVVNLFYLPRSTFAALLQLLRTSRSWVYPMQFRFSVLGGKVNR